MHKDDWEVERAEKQAAVREQQAAESKASKLAQELRALRIKVIFILIDQQAKLLKIYCN